MKKILFIILLAIGFVGCVTPDEIDPSASLNTKGEIIKVIRQNKVEAYILVKFYHKNNNGIMYQWFIGSDTCKVGQIVILR